MEWAMKVQGVTTRAKAKRSGDGRQQKKWRGRRGCDPPDSEPATIIDFRGFVGLAYISGTVVRTQRSTGDTATLPFLFSDMRFMQGIYRGADGKARQGTFGFI